MSVFGDLGSRDLPFKLILRTTAHLFFFHLAFMAYSASVQKLIQQPDITQVHEYHCGCSPLPPVLLLSFVKIFRLMERGGLISGCLRQVDNWI